MSNERLNQLLDFYKNDPSDSFILFAIAKEYEGLEDWNTSLEYFTKLQLKDPNYVGLYYHLAKLYEILGKNIIAQKTYKDGIDIAQKAGDFHAVSELNNALQNLEIQLGN